MKISKHAQQRMRERTNWNHKERRNLFKQALIKGKSPLQIKDERIRNYMIGKKNCKVKLYKDYIFIYSKNSHQLYTMYKLPSELGDDKE